jgi:hypothetical protein
VSVWRGLRNAGCSDGEAWDRGFVQWLQERTTACRFGGDLGGRLRGDLGVTESTNLGRRTGLGVSSKWVHGGRRRVGLEGTPNGLGADGALGQKTARLLDLLSKRCRSSVSDWDRGFVQRGPQWTTAVGVRGGFGGDSGCFRGGWRRGRGGRAAKSSHGSENLGGKTEETERCNTGVTHAAFPERNEQHAGDRRRRGRTDGSPGLVGAAAPWPRTGSAS